MWSHAKEQGQWTGTTTKANGDKVFQLVPPKGSKKKPKTFDSWQAAKKAGWTKAAKVVNSQATAA